MPKIRSLDSMSLKAILSYKDNLIEQLTGVEKYLRLAVGAHREVRNIINPQPDPIVYNSPPIQETSNTEDKDLGMILTSTIDPLEELRARIENEVSIHNE